MDVVLYFRVIFEVVLCYGVMGECDFIVFICVDIMWCLYEICEYIDIIDDIIKIKIYVVFN